MDLKPYRISGFKLKNGFHEPTAVNNVELNKDKKVTLVCRPEFEGVILICVDRDRMRIRKGRIRLSPNEEAQLLKEETEKRRKLRLQQVREQSKENAAQIRKAVKQEKHRQLMKLANDIKNQLESEKAERVRHLEQQYDNSLRNIGVGHKKAIDQPDWSEEREMVRQAENLRAEARGRSALEKHKRETEHKNQEANKVIVARQNALEVERERAKEVASMPPPPPDPLDNIQAHNQRPVKVMDMNNFATTHYHLQNEHAVDRAEPDEQPNAKEAAVQEQDRISERALELRRLRQDQLERARLRHNQALEKELLKHDYNNILHDLSDLQRADRDRRLRVVHHIPKQVFEPPNFRMEDRDDKQRQMEQHFEDMYMAGTDQLGDLSMALDAQPRPLSPSREDSLDVTGPTDGQTPLQEPSLPHVPPVLRDMTNMPRPKSPGKKPEKVLRSLMDRIKSQREEWMTSQSMLEVGEGSQQVQPGQPYPGAHPMDTSDVDMSQFEPLMPDTTPVPSKSVPITAQAPTTSGHVTYAPPTFLPPESQNGYVKSTAGQPMYAPHPAAQTSQAPPSVGQTVFAPPTLPATVGGATQYQPVPEQMARKTAMSADEFSEKLRATNEKQQTNLQMPKDQTELLQILKQQEMILEQKRQLELKLQQLTHDQQKIQLSKIAAQQPQPGQQSQVTSHATHPGVSQSATVNGHHIPAKLQSQAHYMQPQINSQFGSLPQQQVPQPPSYTSLQGQPSQPMSSLPMMPQPIAQAPVMNGFPQSAQQPQQFASSLSSSGMSQQPMNSIPPTNGTTTLPLATMVGQGQMTGYPARSAYQPPSAVLTTDQLSVPAYSQPQMSSMPSNISMATSSDVSMTAGSQGQDVQYPEAVPPASLTADIHTEQMRKVKEYQQQLLSKHEQSKKVLEETKEEIKRRRENLLERYPKLDLSRLENLGAKYLENGAQAPTQTVPQMTQGQAPPCIQGQLIPQGQPVSQAQSQADQAANLSSLLATLASHPYYKATLGLPEMISASMPVQQPQPTSVTVASVQQPPAPSIHPDVNMDSNLRKNKFDNIRKSLPFDQDESFQTPIRVYEAYAQKSLDITSATDITDGDTSTLTSKGSPALQPSSRGGKKGQEEETDATETDMDTTVSGSFLSENDECLTRQDELRKQLAEIQRQKEEIMKRTELGQQKLSKQESELKAKLSQISPAELGQQLAESMRNRQQPQPVQKELLAPPSGPQQSNLSTILEVDTPISTRPSDSGPLSHSSSEGGSISLPARRSAEPGWSGRSEVIQEEPRLEAVETQMQQDAKRKGALETVAEYSGKNISDVLERAKRFESEVLEKLRKQTNAVLFDNEFDDSLEFNVSKRQVSADSLSTGSLSNSSMSTGPLEDSQISKPNDSDLRSANGSFRTTGQNSQNSWAAELSQYQMPASDQSDPSFKVLKPESNRSSLDKSATNGDTMFVDKANRFKVYAAINEKGAPTTEELKQLSRDDVDAKDVIKLLREMQQEFRSGEEARQILVKKLVEQQNNSIQSLRGSSPAFDKSDSRQYSEDSRNHSVSRPFMSDQSKSEYSQYTITDTSTDASLNQASPSAEKSRHSPVHSGPSSKEREVLVRRSPIGDNARTVSPLPSSSSHTAKSKQQPDVSGTEYSFMLTNGNHRTTSTPGEERQKSALDVRASTRSELPSEISLGEKSGSNRNSVKFQDSSIGSPSMSEFKQFSMDSMESKSPGDGLELSTSQDVLTSKSDFRSLSLDSKQTTGELSTFSTAEESLQSIRKEFDKLKSKNKPVEKIKTYAVSRSGELISEQSDSDRSQKRDSNGLSQYSLRDDTFEDKSTTNLSQSTMKSSVQSVSSDSNIKSSSLTTVTSDHSLNATGASSAFGQSFKEMSVSSSVDSNGNNLVQDRFASLDNLISESKNLIQRHKQIIDKNKPKDPVPSQPPVQKSDTRETTASSSLSMSFPKPFISSAKNDTKSSTDTDMSRLTSVDTSDSKQSVSLASTRDQSVSIDRSREKPLSIETSRDQSLLPDNSRDQFKDQSSNLDMNSLDYLTEHSSGILEETLPDLSTEAFTKTGDLSDSGDSLKSFEKHELSETEIDSLANSRSHFNDDSLTDITKSDTVQDIVEARKHNFMIQSERRAAAAKERALAKTTHDEGQVFRAVPVNVVAMPTLSMSVSSGTAEKSSIPKPSITKQVSSFADKKASFEAKEKEVKPATAVTTKPLNRALLPRGPESPQPKDSGMKPTFKSKGPVEQNRFQRSSSSSSTEERTGPMGKLAGEIRQFGGSTGLYQKASSPSPKKTPPKVLPKPVRSKPGPVAQSAQSSAATKSSAPSAGASGLSKTLSSWKKSRAVTSKPASSSITEAPKNSIKVLPQEAPAPLTEEERRKKLEEEQYEKKIRAYNPRLFRLQHKLDASTDDTDSSQQDKQEKRETRKES